MMNTQPFNRADGNGRMLNGQSSEGWMKAVKVGEMVGRSL